MNLYERSSMNLAQRVEEEMSLNRFLGLSLTAILFSGAKTLVQFC